MTKVKKKDIGIKVWDNRKYPHMYYDHQTSRGKPRLILGIWGRSQDRSSPCHLSFVEYELIDRKLHIYYVYTRKDHRNQGVMRHLLTELVSSYYGRFDSIELGKFSCRSVVHYCQRMGNNPSLSNKFKYSDGPDPESSEYVEVIEKMWGKVPKLTTKEKKEVDETYEAYRKWLERGNIRVTDHCYIFHRASDGWSKFGHTECVKNRKTSLDQNGPDLWIHIATYADLGRWEQHILEMIRKHVPPERQAKKEWFKIDPWELKKLVDEEFIRLGIKPLSLLDKTPPV